MPYCMTIDQRNGKRLLHRIQKQPPTRKPRKPFRIYCGGQRNPSGVGQFSRAAQFYLAAYFIAGCRAPFL